MVPESSRDYAEKAFFVSLYINNIYLYRLIVESTTCFLNDIYVINKNNYLEIQPSNITVDLTPKYENKVPYFRDLPFGAKGTLFVSHSRTMDSNWGI